MRRLISLALGLMLLVASAARAQDAHRWQDRDLVALIDAVGMSAVEGLQPADYDIDRLHTVADTPGPERDRIADAAALALAHDYYEGRDRGPDAARWHFDRGNPDYGDWLARALAAHRLGEALQDLLPRSPDYAALRSALSACTERARCDTIRLNLDRWRHLPRELGDRYLWVNLPAFALDLVDGHRVVDSHAVIIGKAATKTPLFSADVTGVTLNPSWHVPDSIIAESVGRMLRVQPARARRLGYVAGRDAEGRLSVVQRPGPDNALGQIKLEMPNAFSVFIHDTPTKSLFDKDVRAFSHGCIRMQDPVGLAARLLPASDADTMPASLDGRETRTIDLIPPVPVYVVYFTAVADPEAPDGVRILDDVYGWDKTPD